MGDARDPEPAREWYEVESFVPSGRPGGGIWVSREEGHLSVDQARRIAGTIVARHSRPARVVRVRAEVVEEFGGGEGGA